MAEMNASSHSLEDTDNSFICESCNRGFEKQKGLAVHRRACKKIKSVQANIQTASTSSTSQRPTKKARKELSSKAAGKRKAQDEPEISPEIMFAPHFQPAFNDNSEALNSPEVEMQSVPEESPFPPDTLHAQSAPDFFVPPPTRRGRQRKFPERYADYLPCTRTRIPHLPPPPPPLHPISPSPEPHREPTPLPPPPPPRVGQFTTEVNEFGMYRVYPTMPSREIDENEELVNVCDGPGLARPSNPPISQWFKSTGMQDPGQSSTHSKGIWAPFLNATVYRLFRWFYTGGNTKSVAEFQRLIDDVLDQPDYNPAHVKDLKVTTILSNLDSHDSTVSPFALENGWKKSSVTLPLPCENVQHTSEHACPTLKIPDVHHRPLLDTIKSAFTDESSKQFHYTPFKQYWNATVNSPPERVVTELYNSDAFYAEHVKIVEQQSLLQQGTSEPRYEIAIAAIMLWSDSTHLAMFGNASLWPIYLYLGNLSKYTRARPTSSSAHHIAYIPSLPSNLQDIYMKAFNNISASTETISHLKRELMHAVWLLLLDPEFMEAYEHGFVIQCSDGIWRRIFPRFFTYSADYPEKVLLSTIKYLAKCPCPRCTTEKKHIPALGTHADIQRRSHKRVDNEYRRFDIEGARRDIYEKGKGAKSKAIEDRLGTDSSIPVRNAFSERLFKHGFNYYEMFVPDLLHEFELGVWKAVFTHLMRILYATGNSNAIQILNKRYRDTPTFGETIRRFSNNAAAMSKLAARDFEDLLQCALPVFESLLPNQHMQIILSLIFVLSTWHALAKLRLHTSSTLAALKAQTRELGFALRRFVKDVCPAYDAKDLPREEAARARRQANKAKKGTTASSKTSKKPSQRKNTRTNNESEDEKAKKTLNLFTYKLHALGDYVDTIWRYGPSDNYSTQVGETEHHRSKIFYARTNKRSGFEKQIATHYRRQNIIRRIGERISQMVHGTASPSPLVQPQSTSIAGPSMSTTNKHPLASAQTINAETSNQPDLALHPSNTGESDANEVQVAVSAEQHYHLPVSKKKKINLFRWVQSNHGDPAFKDFIAELKAHIISRITQNEDKGITYTQEELSHLEFASDAIYEHNVLRVNYTTYDLRRLQDSLNPRTHNDILTLSYDNNPNHPFSYARIIGAFHAEVTYSGNRRRKITRPTRIDFLWVRWFELDGTYRGGWETKRLHRIRFVPSTDESAFGFLDPDCVIRGAHIIPAFAHGTTKEYLPVASVARNKEVRDMIGHEDYKYHYVNMFVDRDMAMRYLGGGIGHIATNEHTSCLRPDFMTPPHLDGNAMETDVESPADDALEIVGIEAMVNLEDEEDPEGEDEDAEMDELEGEADDDSDEVNRIIGGVGDEQDEYGVEGYAPL
ncbi:hypothetical protein CVT24_007275 [Panaeolus cyanescens]|uniref:C2H2-type domain-containing protein n=1 Tax=Panaeolus cyanescens TaxID=181874 RepID=A0A409VJ62_9AGAR|nr:hypothetical protein CVT24_007275 [Panaeolus cyanescens]